MVRYLVNSARTFIFSTAPPPPAVAGALAALELLQERPRRLMRLQSNVAALRSELGREGFDLRGSRTHIIPLVVGDPGLAIEWPVSRPILSTRDAGHPTLAQQRDRLPNL